MGLSKVRDRVGVQGKDRDRDSVGVEGRARVRVGLSRGRNRIGERGERLGQVRARGYIG